MIRNRGEKAILQDIFDKTLTSQEHFYNNLKNSSYNNRSKTLHNKNFIIDNNRLSSIHRKNTKKSEFQANQNKLQKEALIDGKSPYNANTLTRQISAKPHTGYALSPSNKNKPHKVNLNLNVGVNTGDIKKKMVSQASKEPIRSTQNFFVVNSMNIQRKSTSTKQGDN